MRCIQGSHLRSRNVLGIVPSDDEDMTGAGDLLSSLPLFVGALVGVSGLVFVLSPFCELSAFEEDFLREESVDFALYGLLLAHNELDVLEVLPDMLELQLDNFTDMLEIELDNLLGGFTAFSTSLTRAFFLCSCFLWSILAFFTFASVSLALFSQ